VTKSESRSVKPVKPKKKVAAKRVKVDAVQPVSGNGTAPSNQDVLRRMYALMLKSRMLTEQARRLLNGRAQRIPSDSLGHEAVVVGATLELGPEDTMVASPRNFAALVARGASLEFVLSQAASENEIQAVVANQHSRATFSVDPFNLGTGVALAQKLEKKRNVVVALCAEDTSPSERWHEAMKFAGIHKLPILYVMKRSSAFDLDPASRTPVLDDVSFVAHDCGFPAIIVDSNDAVAVWRVAQESIHRARSGAGPTLIECEVQLAHAGDPLAQMEHYMKKRGSWDDQWRQDAWEQIAAEIADAVVAGR
jgi:TPP-dependent pyruvate/acetoin dehydrogenase alpha subunit